MSSNLNKQVTTKFQIANKPIQSKITNAGPLKTWPSNTLRAKPVVQTPAKAPTCTVAEGAKQIKSRSLDNNASRMRAAAAGPPKTFQTYMSRPYWSQPNALARRMSRLSTSKVFDYHLSEQEINNYGKCNNPMKAVPVNEQELLKSGQRATYLVTRYDRTPDSKYNYPESTNWRYGWFHRKDATQ